MPVSFKGMDCLADANLDAYMDEYMKSQATIPWASQVYYGYYTLYYGCAFIIVAGLKNGYYRWRDSRYRNNGSTTILDQFANSISGYSRLFGYKNLPAKISHFTSLPPSGGNSLFLISTSLYLLLWVFLPHFWYRGCRGFGSPPLAVRAGIMATALTPFIYILGGKTNFITLLTGISYEKLNYLHQYAGVAALTLSLIHTIPFIYQDLVEGGYKNLAEDFKGFSMYSGIPPLVCLILLCTLSKSFVRKWFYEIFWHVHWILGVGYFATLFWHIWDMLDTENYMWAALAFWFGQLFYRLLVKTCFRPNALFMRSRKAKLYKLPGSKSFEIDIPNNKGIVWRPGQHAFIRFKSKILDNHPFSIVNLPKEDGDEVKFIVVPKRGLTGTLYQEIENNTSNVVDKDVYIDGPYGGCSRDHNSFEKVILIATGSGITATLPFLLDLVEKIKSGENKTTRRIEFIWIVRYSHDIDWVKSELIQSITDFVNINVYVTHEENSIIDDEKETLEEKVSSSSYEGLSVHHFKPQVSELLIGMKYSLARRNMVVSSGSNSMKFEVCNAVSSLQSLVVNDHIEEIFLHTESFGW
ncbi:ferric/cupric reductase transmembrane component 7 [[Candida] jaroonii]|uniref:Ferric/cupric reductase transmembrane component 7 n=1 Tax=[Candida] jaroonii TaxID=467808 RepID=A0ACA9Y7D9_9ASCO|nr:ferric/cupric reductase transmembrane component 7 [[Candida] jaroonii]